MQTHVWIAQSIRHYGLPEYIYDRRFVLKHYHRHPRVHLRSIGGNELAPLNTSHILTVHLPLMGYAMPYKLIAL